MVKLVLVGGVYKPPKLENVGPGFYPQGPPMAAKVEPRMAAPKRFYRKKKIWDYPFKGRKMPQIPSNLHGQSVRK